MLNYSVAELRVTTTTKFKQVTLTTLSLVMKMATMPLPTSTNVLPVVTPSHNATVLNRATVV